MIHHMTASLVIGLIVLVATLSRQARSDTQPKLQEQLCGQVEKQPVNRNSRKPEDASTKKRNQYVRALDTVLKEAAKHHPFGERQFKVSVEEDSEGWVVHIIFLPRTPSDELVGRVKHNGEVTVAPLY